MKRVLAILALAGLGYAALVAAGIPSRDRVRALAHEHPERTSLMQQRDEEARRAGRKPRRSQSWVPLSRVSRHLIHAVVAAEDPNFFGHQGIDWDAVKESVETNVRRRSFARGGSTITQQLAKNLFFTTGKTLTRKLREIVAARWLEEDLSKKRILELYLNLIEWGDEVYGCEAAAQRYYGTSAATLDAKQAAGLAAMIPSPRRINPRVDAARHARAQERILWLMERLGYVRRGVAQLGAEPPAELVPEEVGPFEPEPPESAPADEAASPSAGEGPGGAEPAVPPSAEAGDPLELPPPSPSAAPPVAEHRS